MISYLGIIGASLGLSVSLYIYRQKKKKKKLICPREGSCERVVHSTYATTFGIHNEYLGIAFYAVMVLVYIISLSVPVGGIFVWVVTIMTITGALFSIYLIALQALVIRAWCLWCLGSAFSMLLLTIALFGFDTREFFALLAAQHIWWVIMHNIGFILGLGGATITDIFFFRFLKDYAISAEEKATMDILSNIIWIGLGILIVSGIMLYLPEQARLIHSPKFLLKLIVVSVIVINGLLLNLLVAPRMRQFSFAETLPARHFRALAFALGAISITSWYTAFFLGSVRKIHLSLWGGLSVYIILMVGAIIGSQVYETMLIRKNKSVVPPSQR